VTRQFQTLALLVLVALPCISRAEVVIDPSCRMKNRPPGRCGWCAVETLGRHHRIKALFGLVDAHESIADPEDLTAVLDHLKVSYSYQARGSRDTAILRRASREALGAAVGFRPLSEGAGGHIVTLVDFNEETVKVIDPNDDDLRVRTMPTERFLHWWDGLTIVIEPAREKK
jgi:hypothetical protein